MKKDHDARQALETLLREEGMADEELETLFAQELMKGDEMDADLVVEVVTEAEAEQQPTFDATVNWATIEKKLDQREYHPSTRRWSARWALTAAAVLAVFAMITVGTANSDAWRWDFLIEVFRPVMTTLGIYVNVEDLGSAGMIEESAKTTSPDAEVESVSQVLRDEREVPNTVLGIAAKPSWLPDGFAFQYAQAFNDFNESSLMIAYRRNSTELFVQTVVYPENATLTAVNVSEKDDNKEAKFANSITIIENDGVICATMVDNLAYYTVWGRLSQEDISSVITSIR